MIKKTLLPSALLVAIIGCNLNNQNEKNDSMADLPVKKEIKFSKEVIREIIKVIPNPVLMSNDIKKVSTNFYDELLNPVENVDKYTTNFQKAINLGIYGTDLVHLNVYNRTTSTMLYLETIKNIANDLKIGQFFDYKTLIRLSENNTNVDSVLHTTTSGFEKMNNYLLEQDRSKMSVLITFGSWLESLHLALTIKELPYYSKQYTNINELSPDKKEFIYKRIGEQKVILDNISLLLSIYKNDKEFKELINDIQLLKKQFDKVNVSYTYQELTAKKVDGNIMIVDNKTSFANVTDEIIENLAKTTSTIREKIIN